MADRPDSPPPRQPSPDFLLTPLPYPRHPRRITSQPKIKTHNSFTAPPPPGLQPATKTLQPARSYDFLRSERSPVSSDDDHSSFQSARMRTRSALMTPALTVSESAPSTPGSSRPPSVKNSPDFTRTHRRTVSVAFPKATPVVSPSSAHSLSVPSVPQRYTGSRQIVCSQPVSAVPIIILPDINQPQSDVRFPSAYSEQEKPSSHVLPPLEKHKSMGMACLKFFGIRSRPPQSRVVAL